MSKQILREISLSIQNSKFFSLMTYEVTDISNMEQFVICLHHVDENFEPHEDFVALQLIYYIKSDVLGGVFIGFNVSDEPEDE